MFIDPDGRSKSFIGGYGTINHTGSAEVTIYSGEGYAGRYGDATGDPNSIVRIDGVQYNSPPEDNWGGGSRRSSGGVNDETPPGEVVEGGKAKSDIGPFPEICPLYMYQQHSQYRTVYVTDDKGNFVYYFPDGSIESSTASPRDKMLSDITTVLLPNAIRYIPALKKPTFELMGKMIEKFVPQLNKGPGIRVGISKSHGRKVFRATYGNRNDHFFDIDLGKIEKVKP